MLKEGYSRSVGLKLTPTLVLINKESSSTAHTGQKKDLQVFESAYNMTQLTTTLCYEYETYSEAQSIRLPDFEAVDLKMALF